MRYLLIVLSLSVCFSQVNAQNTPLFETTTYVKDAIGNLDSVQIGFNPDDIKDDTIQFHEVIDNSPVDSIFGRRVMGLTFDDWDLSTQPMYKRYITGTQGWGGYQFGGHSLMFIHAKYQPVTIYWNRLDFYNMPCAGESYFTPDVYSLLVEPWIWVANPNTVAVCAAAADSMTLFLYDHPIAYPDGTGGSAPFMAFREVEGTGIDTVIGVALNTEFYYNLSPCQFVVNTKQPLTHSELSHSLQIFPTLSDGRFTALNDRPEPITVLEVYDVSGRIISTISGGSDILQTVNLHEHLQGVYFIHALWKDGFVGVAKVIITR
jgi:hypothetical protein